MKKKKVKIEVQTVPETEVKSGLTNPLHGVKFWLFVIGAALLLALAIWLFIDSSFAASLTIIVTGIATIIFGITRLIPLVKTRKSALAKVTTIIEIIINILLGVFLLYASTYVKEDTDFGNFINNYYRYFLGFIFYAKAIFYFINTSLIKEETNKVEFWLHILIITLAVVIFASNIDATKLAILVAVLAIICGIFLIGVAGGTYNNYRKTLNKKPKVSKDEEKEEDIEDEEEIILPNPEDAEQPYVN